MKLLQSQNLHCALAALVSAMLIAGCSGGAMAPGSDQAGASVPPQSHQIHGLATKTTTVEVFNTDSGNPTFDAVIPLNGWPCWTVSPTPPNLPGGDNSGVLTLSYDTTCGTNSMRLSYQVTIGTQLNSCGFETKYSDNAFSYKDYPGGGATCGHKPGNGVFNEEFDIGPVLGN